MKKPELITMIFDTQRDLYKTIKQSEAEKETYEQLRICENTLQDAIKNRPELKDLLVEYDNAYLDYLIECEDAAYYHGFKTAFKIFLELGSQDF